MPLGISRLALASIGGAALVALGTGHVAADEVISLTQTGCQFLEPEHGIDRGFKPESAKDCEAINAISGEQRLAEAKVLELEPGTYTFRITNSDVPYELGFWLREQGYEPGNPLHMLTRTSVSGDGLSQGESEDYVVELEAGEYLYSCPLNPTPDYRILVQGRSAPRRDGA